MAEVNPYELINVIRASKLTNWLSNFKISQSAGTNWLINCFSGQNGENVDLSLLKIALAVLVQILQTFVNISQNWLEKQLIRILNQRHKENFKACISCS